MTRPPLRSIALIALVLLVGAVAPGFGQDKTLVIGSLLELTGPFSPTAPAMGKAVKLATDEANKAAQAAGVAITVKQESADTQGDAQAALSAARTLVNKGAACLVGPATTPESISIAKGLTIQKKIILWPQATSGRLTAFKPEAEDTIFRSVPPDNLQAVALADAIEATLGGASGKSVSVAYRNEPYGEGLSKEFGATWQGKGGKVLGPIAYDPKQAVFDSEAARIVEGNPDAYMIVDYPDSYVKMGAALLRTGKFDANKLFVPDAMAFTEVPKNIPAASLEGARGTRAGTPQGTAAAREFDRLWKAAGGADRYSLDANTFDAAMVCFLAAVAADSTDPSAIKAKVREITGGPGEKYTFVQLGDAVKALKAGKKIDFDGVSGPLDLDRNGDTTASLYDVFQYKSGKLEVVRQIDVKRK
jgi:ABC-type branched-subunit amino acid transport system substrate-binding protein